MAISITKSLDGGRVLQGKTLLGSWLIEVDVMGNCKSWKFQIREAEPSGFDPKTEKTGCCDPPDPSLKR